jgi:MFS superfamily sulfate permease-like transporter
VTLLLVVTQDLLTGVLVGIGLSLLELIPVLRNLRLKVVRVENDGHETVHLAGAATFLTLPKLSGALDAVPEGAPMRLDMSQLSSADHTTAELLKEWLARRRAAGGQVEVYGASERLTKQTA